MKTIASQTQISAPPEHLWDVLADFDSYTEWNPFMDQVNGDAEGAQ